MIALFAGMGWYAGKVMLDTQKKVAVEVNVAGRQRMLSQRIAMLAASINDSIPGTERTNRDMLRGCANLMIRAHLVLKSSDQKALQALAAEGISCQMRALPVLTATALPPEISVAFEEGFPSLDALVEEFVMLANRLADSPDIAGSDRHMLLLLARHQLPSRLDRLTKAYQQSGERALERMEAAMLVDFLGILGLLLAIMLLIFRPMESRLTGSLQRLRDMVADLKDKEETLVEARHQAESANHAKTLFLATMSHEIRTPLNGILGMAGLLQESGLRDDQRNRLDVIMDSGNHLLSVINNVLDMSRIEAGRAPLNEVPVDILELVHGVASEFEDAVWHKNLGFRTQTALEKGLVAKTDPLHLRRILQNLLGNALKFTARGNITFHISQEGKRGDGTLVFEVRDTGIGIAEARLEEVFEPFSQADMSITREYGGTGLGLAISRDLAEMMGGRLEAESQTGVGSCFRLNLPWKAVDIPVRKSVEQDHQEKVVTGGSVRQARKMNILVVEDNLVNSMVARGFLEKAGHNVTIAENGLLATDIVHEQMFDLVFMDVHMPVMDGVTATRHIRADYNGRGLPIVGLTAEILEDRHREFREAGMNEVMSKPFTRDALLDVVARYS